MKTCGVIDLGLTDYGPAWDLQKAVIEARREGSVLDLLLLTEHPHVYTVGRGGRDDHLLADDATLRREGITVYQTDRGGDITYHGPGQLVGYPILDLRGFYLDAHRYLRDLEEVIIRTVADYGIRAGRNAGLTGVWVGDAKIAAIGVKISRWITFHGFAFNVNTDLRFFGGIVPCGISGCPVTSLSQLCGQRIELREVAERLIPHFGAVFEVQINPITREGFDRVLQKK
ncbi:MAG: lipoyl(octanoyl) transferase LipB [Candidatus Latescibacteria bacterium]|nr:lipoyl(octanoyl) transferase LipB [Candidatus Latescibacterota bacterium]